jgi:hypothetical protein
MPAIETAPHGSELHISADWPRQSSLSLALRGTVCVIVGRTSRLARIELQNFRAFRQQHRVDLTDQVQRKGKPLRIRFIL